MAHHAPTYFCAFTAVFVGGCVVYVDSTLAILLRRCAALPLRDAGSNARHLDKARHHRHLLSSRREFHSACFADLSRYSAVCTYLARGHSLESTAEHRACW